MEVPTNNVSYLQQPNLLPLAPRKPSRRTNKNTLIKSTSLGDVGSSPKKPSPGKKFQHSKRSVSYRERKSKSIATENSVEVKSKILPLENAIKSKNMSSDTLRVEELREEVRILQEQNVSLTQLLIACQENYKSLNETYVDLEAQVIASTQKELSTTTPTTTCYSPNFRPRISDKKVDTKPNDIKNSLKCLNIKIEEEMVKLQALNHIKGNITS